MPFSTLYQVVFCMASEVLQECEHLCNSAGPRFTSGSQRKEAGQVEGPTDHPLCMDLDTAANYADIFGLLTILGAAVYSFYQIKEMKASRESQGALALSEHLQRPEFIAAIIAMSGQPDLITTEEYKEHHGEAWKDVVTLATTWETLGALVHRGDLDFHLVYDIYGGLVAFSHGKMLPWVEDERRLYGETRLEWFTWLAERIEEYNAAHDNHLRPAHIEYKDWKPRKK